MASLGDSFLNMAEAMLGKHNRSSSFEALAAVVEMADASTPDLKPINSDNTDASTSSSSNNSDSQNDRQINTSDKMDERENIFVITPPKRRRRMTGNYPTIDAIHRLNTAMSRSERLGALQNATGTFSHNDQNFHDNEIEAGADVALVKSLIFLEFKASFHCASMDRDVEALTKEKAMILKCLECVYRASSDAVGKSFGRVGDDLLQILVALVNDETKRRKSSTKSPPSNPSKPKALEKCKDDQATEEKGNSSEEANSDSNKVYDEMIRTATKIMGHFARVGKATRPMACYPGFLGSVLELCNVRPYSEVPFEARLNCLWTISNLACNADNMALMTGTPNLITSLITISSRRPDSCASIEAIMEILRAQSITSRTFLNLSWSSENKIAMAKNPVLIQTLCKLVMERQAPYKNSKTMHNILVQTRRHSLASLRNISAAPKPYKISLCSYNNGEVLDTLTDAILNEVDQSAVKFSFCAIHNLAIDENAEAIVNRPALVLALKNVLLEDRDISREGEAHTDIKCQCASATILVLEKSITPDKPSYENFRELLDTINPSCNSTDCAEESSPPKPTAV